MPKYNVYGTVTGGKYLGEFEADTPDAAKDMAMASDANSVCLCHQCNSECEDPEITELHADLIETALPTPERGD